MGDQTAPQDRGKEPECFVTYKAIIARNRLNVKGWVQRFLTEDFCRSYFHSSDQWVREEKRWYHVQAILQTVAGNRYSRLKELLRPSW